MTEDIVTDGTTSYEAMPDGHAEPIPAGETIHVEDLHRVADQIAGVTDSDRAYGNERDIVAIERPHLALTGFQAVRDETAMTRPPMTIVDVLPTPILLRLQRALNLSLAYVPQDDQTLRDEIHALLTIRP